MQFGVDSVIGALLPGIGDALGTVLGLYQIFLCMLFGIGAWTLGWMVSGFFLFQRVYLIPPLFSCSISSQTHSSESSPSSVRLMRWMRAALDHNNRSSSSAGDFLDVAFKANIYNLNLLESELKKSRWAPVVRSPFVTLNSTLISPAGYNTSGSRMDSQRTAQPGFLRREKMAGLFFFKVVRTHEF